MTPNEFSPYLGVFRIFYSLIPSANEIEPGAAFVTLAALSLVPELNAEPIEPCLPFWTEGLGFEVVVTVPGDGGTLAFAMLRKDSVEVQYQTCLVAVA